MGRCIQIQNIFHSPDKLSIDNRDAPLLPHPRLALVFLSLRRTVSVETSSTTFNSTKRSANNSKVQRFCPAGGLLSVSAIRTASPFLSSFSRAPGRGRSLSAPSRLPSTNRRRVRCTVDCPVCNASAISRSDFPSLASNNIRARLSLRAPCSPLLIRCSNEARYSSDKSTTYFFLGIVLLLFAHSFSENFPSKILCHIQFVKVLVTTAPNRRR